MSEPSDRCSDTAHGSSVVQICSAPTTICTPYSAAAVPTRPSIVSAPGTSPSVSLRRTARHTTSVVTRTMTPAMAATTRCENWRICRLATVGSSEKVGMSWPSKRGHSGKISAAQPAAPRSTPGQVVSAPKSSTANTEMAANPTSSGMRKEAPWVGRLAGKRERMSTNRNAPSRIMAVARWASTVSAELFMSTVTLPR